MLVTCQICKKKIERDSAYKITTEKGNKYYCNKAEYESMQKAKQIKDTIYKELCDIFGYEIQNSALWAEWKLWNKIADNEKILSYIQENKDYIKSAVGRLNSTEYAHVRYVSAILKNSLKDYNNRGKRAQLPIFDDAIPKESSFVLFEPVEGNKKVRKSFAELEDNL